MTSRRIKIATAVTTLPLLFAMETSLANGVTGRLQVSQGLENVTESGNQVNDDEGLRSITGLSLDMASETNTQRFFVALDTSLAYNFSEDNDEGLDFENTGARIGYDLNNRSSALGITLSFREADVDDEVFITDPITGDGIFVSGGGQVETIRLQSRLALRQDDPLSFSFSHSYTDRTYKDTSDPNLADSTTQTFDARAILRLSETTSVGVFSAYDDFDEDGPGGTQRTTLTSGVTADYRLNRTTNLSAALDYTDIDSNTNDSSTGGPGFSLGLTHDRPNGAIRIATSRTETVNGERDEISIGRSLNFRRGLADFSYGLARNEGLDLEPLINVRLSYTLSDLSQINANLSQTAETATNNTETRQTRLSVNYSRQLTATSQIIGSLQLADQNELGPGSEDERNVEASITYTQRITRDWNLDTGYSFSRNDGENGTRETSRLFVGLSRSFNFRP